MAQEWQDLGNGRKKLTITDDQGRVPPVHVYGTEQEILAKLAESKINGNAVIAQAKGSKSLTAGDRMQIVADLKDPAKVDSAIARVVETVVPVDEIKRNSGEERLERQIRLATEAAATFADTTPDWHNSEHNKRTLVEYMKRLGLDNTNVSHYRKAFDELKAANLLQAKPAGEEFDEGETITDPEAQTTERTAPAPTAQRPPAPTRFSTGVRSSDISGQQPRPTNRLKYTREQIESMSTAKMRTLMNDPDFIKASEFYAAEDRKRAGQRRAG
jgi:hypothetical protein